MVLEPLAPGTLIILTGILTTTLIISGVIQRIYNEAKEQGSGFLGILLGKLGASLVGNTLAGKDVTATRQGRGVITAGEG